MYKYFLLSLLIVSCSSLPKENSKDFTFNKVATLPSTINESSGLVVIDGQLITHNDSGGMPMLYQIDTTGTITDYVTYDYLYNKDWESITQSDNEVHIADIGNNRGDRKDLKIYNICKDGLWQQDLEPDVSQIAYETQTDFTVRPQKHSYDAESILVINETIYLFSKDWLNFTTAIYNFPLHQDTVLNHLQIIDTKGLITDAAYNNEKRVLLCGYNQSLVPFIVELEINEGVFSLVKKLELPIEGAQIEAIAYYSTNKQGDELYYLTSEAVNIKLGDDEAKTPGELYKLVWKP